MYGVNITVLELASVSLYVQFIKILYLLKFFKVELFFYCLFIMLVKIKYVIKEFKVVIFLKFTILQTHIVV